MHLGRRETASGARTRQVACTFACTPHTDPQPVSVTYLREQTGPELYPVDTDDALSTGIPRSRSRDRTGTKMSDRATYPDTALATEEDYAEYLRSWAIDIVEKAPEFVANVPEALQAKPAEKLSRPTFLDTDWDEDTPQATPTLLPVDGGIPLLYPGESHYLYGRGGSGKSWMCYVAAREVSRAGGVTLIVDYESNRSTVKSRMKALGVTREEAGRIAYWKITGSLNPKTEAGAAFQAWVIENKPSMVVLDSVSRALSYLGLEENLNSDYAAFDRMVVQPLTLLGVTTLMIDHIGHDNDRGGIPAPRGASGKLDHISGAMYFFRTTQAWSRAESGSAVILCVKDREGSRKYGEVAANVTVDVDTATGAVEFSLSAQSGGSEAPVNALDVLGYHMEKVSAWLAANPGSWNMATLKLKPVDGGAGLSAKKSVATMDRLVNLGYVKKVGTKYAHEKPFTRSEHGDL